MTVALDLRAGGWLGGRYYLENLVRALQTLPDREQPRVVGLLPGDATSFPPELLEVVPALPPETEVVFPNWNVRGEGAFAELHWIPDLQHRFLTEHFSRLERLKRDFGHARLGWRALLIVVSSDVVRRHVARYYPFLSRRLRVLRFRTVVPAEALSVDPRETAKRYGLPEEYLLLPNQFWTHKNHATAFAAAHRLDAPLVCTGATDDHRDPGYFARLTAGLREDRVRILGVVPRDDYLQLLRAAAAVVQPSLFEGWSSVVEDARALGLPIALSDIPVHREQDPPNGWFFSPTQPDALAAAAVAAARAGRVQEDRALAEQRRRIEEYARGFVALCGEARDRRR